jgi:hypothetical protein
VLDLAEELAVDLAEAGSDRHGRARAMRWRWPTDWFHDQPGAGAIGRRRGLRSPRPGGLPVAQDVRSHVCN